MSGKRNLVFSNGEYYHILNRSIANEEIFINKINQRRFLSLMDYYRYPQNLSFSKYKKIAVQYRRDYFDNYTSNQPLIELYAYSMMPNHYHFALKQLVDDGVKVFVSNLQNAFAKYYNTKFKRDGGLFKRPFRGKRIENDKMFLHISRYIHLNPISSCLMKVEYLKNSLITSYPFYTGTEDSDLVNTRFILSIVGSKDNYIKFVEDHADYQRNLKQIKSMILE